MMTFSNALPTNALPTNASSSSATAPSEGMNAFAEKIQAKINRSLEEFAQGKLSREQFHAIYAHYDAQLRLVAAAQADKEHGIHAAHPEAEQTLAIRQATMGKAIGLHIFHNDSGARLDTLGIFDPELERSEGFSRILDDLHLMRRGRMTVSRRIAKLAERQWILLAGGKYTTLMALFHNEPSQDQAGELERLHHDFELANAYFLAAPQVDSDKLAYPFLVFIQKKLKGA